MCIVYLTCPDKLLEKEISLVFEFGWHDIIKKLKTFYLSIGPLRGFLKYFLFKELSYDKESISCISFLGKKRKYFSNVFFGSVLLYLNCYEPGWGDEGDQAFLGEKMDGRASICFFASKVRVLLLHKWFLLVHLGFMSGSKPWFLLVNLGLC